MGCCAHIASVLWYLGFERHQPATKGPKIHNKYMHFLSDAAAEVWEANTTPQKKVIQNDMSKCVSIISDRNDELLRPLKVILALTDTNLVSATTVQPFYTTNTLEFNSCKHFSPVN